ncbi:porin [Vibrio sp. SCSIO 43136]|uniref:porin n=1 Tax=Vibrio sp. SCSIO 43136 TaxID=2819101 RepID=UPI0020754367|nr:porin [Vibrio sp. SCSIO 43136]USD65507.1 porin [Vibrio sp. SCSIO 43136]
MTNKNAIAIALSAMFAATGAHAATIYQQDNGDYMKLYGEVGVGGHIGARYEYGEFYTEDKSYIDDSFATMGVKGIKDKMHYRLELDYERENWPGGSGDMVLAIDKVFLGYDVLDDHYLEVGLTDTAFDDYDKWGDFTFDTTVETGEAGDQDQTVKYEGLLFDKIKVAGSYTYAGKTSSGSEVGNVTSSYIGYFDDDYSAVIGYERRTGSEGRSKYGKQQLVGLGARYRATEDLWLGINGFYEEEDIAQEITPIDVTDPNNKIYVYNDFQTLKNKGALVSAKYALTDIWELTLSANYEAYEKWDKESKYWDGKDSSWGKERTWQTFGVNYRPTRSSVIALELNAGEAAQRAYAYARVYF